MEIKVFRNIILLFLLSILATTIIPGIVSKFGGTFYQADIMKKLPKEQLDKLLLFDEQKNKLDEKISSIDNRINEIVNNSSKEEMLTLDELLKSKEKFLADRENLKPPIRVVPYYLNPQMLLWLGIYSAFFILIYLIKKEAKSKFGISRKVINLGMLLYFFYEWPMWMRNFVLGNSGRTLYAYPNFDIDKLSFFCQELIILFFCLSASKLIVLCTDMLQTKSYVESEENDVNNFLLTSSNYSNAYRNWFIYSAILALGFISFTSFFWKLVFTFGDQRYLISAVNAHIIWALCWFAISLNLLQFMRVFDKQKRELIRNNPDERTLKIVLEHQPANNLTLIISGIASLTTFLLPLIKMLL